MKLYHARFVGNKLVYSNSEAYECELLVRATNIHDVKSLIEDRYMIVSSYCVTDLDATNLDNYIIEISK
jgi:hypothetical protein